MDRMVTWVLPIHWGLSFFHKGCTGKGSLGTKVTDEMMGKMNSIMRMCYGCIVEAFAILLTVCKLCYRCCLHRLALVLLCFSLSLFTLHISFSGILSVLLVSMSFTFMLFSLVLSNIQNSA